MTRPSILIKLSNLTSNVEATPTNCRKNPTLHPPKAQQELPPLPRRGNFPYSKNKLHCRWLTTLLFCLFIKQNLVCYPRLMEAFVSIQLEKVGLRDEMLNSFMKKKQTVGGLIKTPVSCTQWWMILRGLSRMINVIGCPWSKFNFSHTTGGSRSDQKEAHNRLSQEVCPWKTSALLLFQVDKQPRRDFLSC